MAIATSIATEYGIPAIYWHIGGIQTDYRGKGVDVTVYGFASQEARESGAQPISAVKQQFTGDQYEADVTRSIVYNWIKQLPQFAGATDC
jgi:predicted GNAT family acetyltransferase